MKKLINDEYWPIICGSVWKLLHRWMHWVVSRLRCNTRGFSLEKWSLIKSVINSQIPYVSLLWAFWEQPETGVVNEATTSRGFIDHDILPDIFRSHHNYRSGCWQNYGESSTRYNNIHVDDDKNWEKVKLVNTSHNWWSKMQIRQYLGQPQGEGRHAPCHLSQFFVGCILLNIFKIFFQ